jgi:hypothetical protein
LVCTGAAAPMITGHFGFAAGAKTVDVRAPLWCLMLATVWLDIICTGVQPGLLPYRPGEFKLVGT